MSNGEWTAVGYSEGFVVFQCSRCGAQLTRHSTAAQWRLGTATRPAACSCWERLTNGIENQPDEHNLRAEKAEAAQQRLLDELDRAIVDWQCVSASAKSQAARAANAEAEVAKMAAYLERCGHRRCDTAACNCGSWHDHRAEQISVERASLRSALDVSNQRWATLRDVKIPEASGADVDEWGNGFNAGLAYVLGEMAALETKGIA